MVFSYLRLVIKNIKLAYHQGYEQARLKTNMHLFGTKLTRDHREHVYPVEAWDRRIKDLYESKTRLNPLERIAFSFGDEDFTTNAWPNLPKPKEPY